MKKLNILILFVLLMALIGCLLTFQIFSAEDEEEEDPYYLISYYVGDSLKESAKCYEGTTLTVRASMSNKSNQTFYGWFSDDGVLYKAGEKVEFKKDTKLYEAWGGTVSTRDQLQSNLSGTDKNWYYTVLTEDIVSDKQFNLIGGGTGGLSIVDLNGHNITINSSSGNAFSEARAGIVFVGKGTVTFNTTASNKSNIAFYSTRIHSYGDGAQRLWVGKDVTIVAPDVSLVQTTGDMSSYPGLPTIRIYGDVTCSMIARMVGAKNASCDIYPGSKVRVSAPYLFTDTSQYTEGIMKVTIHGGEIYMAEQTEFTETPEKFNIDLMGGLYNKNISHLISTKLRCTLRDDGMYEITDNYCAGESPTGYHRYLATEITVDCENDGRIVYECQYCNDIYIIERRALGHTYVRVLTKEVVNTEERTERGEYTTTCERCGATDIEYLYPEPATVYITVKVRLNAKEYSLRLPASQFFLFDSAKPGKLMTYVPQSFTAYIDGMIRDIMPANVFSIEIPLGTTEINGGTSSGSPIGVFYGNDHFEEIILPSSLEIVRQYAFADMSKIKSIVGIEYISNTIESYAFAQLSTSTLWFKELTLNANVIGGYSFRNISMDTLRFTKNVRTIDSNAFALSGKSTRGLKEIIVDALADYGVSGVKMSALINTYPIFTTCPTGGDFNTILAYSDHNYKTDFFPATCVRGSYTASKCTQCGDEIVETQSSYVNKDNHTYLDDLVYEKPTCVATGGWYKVCKDCGFRYRDGNPIPIDPNAHDWETIHFAGEGYRKDKDCTEWHYDQRICNLCGFEEEEEDWKRHKFSSHDFSIIIDELAPTCGDYGYIDKLCKYCDVGDLESLPPQGQHTRVEDTSKHVDATCVSTGWIVYICKVCGKQLNEGKEEVKINPEAHNWETTQTETDENGYYTIHHVCLNGCGADFDDIKRDPNFALAKATERDKFPVWAILLIIFGGIVLVVGVVSTIYFTIFKKKNKAKKFKYNFNTLKK